jgi:glycosyltransferase involved in cell wall biosynthesis
VPFFKELAEEASVEKLRILTCVKREIDREWLVEDNSSYEINVLSGLTFNLRRGSDGHRILHLRFGILGELLGNRPDRLIIGDASWTSYLAAAACRLLKIPYVVWNEVTTTSQTVEGPFALMRRRMYAGAYKLVASCQMAKDYLVNNGAKDSRIYIVLNAVDNRKFLELERSLIPKRESIRSKIGVPKEAICFIFVGQLISRKRIIETVNMVHGASLVAPVFLLVVGSGPLETAAKERVRELNTDAIKFFGFSDIDRLSELYTAADALVLLSVDEPWGMVVNEAALFGLTIFSSEAVGASAELSRIAPERVKFISSFEDPQSLFQGLAHRSPTLLSDPKKMADGFVAAIQ